MSEETNDQNTNPSPPVVSNDPNPADASPPVDGSPEIPPANSNDIEDVEAALLRETHDGPGFESEDELDDEDFDGYAEDDVEDDA